jgi:SNF2 family DNA or RNA helicase
MTLAFMQVGLGKTPEMLAIILDNIAQDAKLGIAQPGPALIVVPLTLVQQTLDAIAKFTKLKLSQYGKYYGPKRCPQVTPWLFV